MKMILILLFLLCFGGTPAFGAEQAAEEQQHPRSTLMYAAGAGIAKSLMVGPEDLEAIEAGLRDAAYGRKLRVDPSEFRGMIQRLYLENKRKRLAEELAAYAREPGALKLPSGLIFKELRPGTGDRPKAESTVKANYRGTFPDGYEFDSSEKRGEPAVFSLKGTIRCWTEALQRMRVGAKAQIVCPSKIAFGRAGMPPTIPPDATLVYEVELLSIE